MLHSDQHRSFVDVLILKQMTALQRISVEMHSLDPLQQVQSACDLVLNVLDIDMYSNCMCSARMEYLDCCVSPVREKTKVICDNISADPWTEIP